MTMSPFDSDFSAPWPEQPGAIEAAHDENVQMTPYQASFVDTIYMALADASQGTVDPSRAEEIARRALLEACDNREGK